MAERGPDFGIEHFISPDATNEVVSCWGDVKRQWARPVVLGCVEAPEGYTDEMLANIGRALILLDQIDKMERE